MRGVHYSSTMRALSSGATKIIDSHRGLAALLFFGATVPLFAAPPVETTPYEIVVQKDIMVKMRDGAKLGIDIHRPARQGNPVNGSFPVILIRTLGGKQNIDRIFHPVDFVQRGYIIVIQDVRGLYSSDGSYYHGRDEGRDGYDTIEWIATQPWSDGKIGMTGVSYGAAVQTAAAALNPPHLSSLFHIESPPSYYLYGLRHGGVFLNFLLRSAFQFARASKIGRGDPVIGKAIMVDWLNQWDWLYRLPPKKGLSSLAHAPDAEAWFLEPFYNEEYGEFWTRLPLWEPLHYVDNFADAAGYYFGGWWDPYNEDIFYSTLIKRNTKPLKLIMGPWPHARPLNGLKSYFGQVDFGPQSVLAGEDFRAMHLRWFDETLKGEDTGILDEPPVKIFIMGGGECSRNKAGRHQHGGEWRLENEWPLARTQYTKYYLQAGGKLAAGRPGPEPSFSRYYYDPDNPVPTIGAQYPFWTAGWLRYEIPDLLGAPTEEVPYGPYDQREDPRYFGCKTSLPLSSRHDVLVFQTPPLERDIEVTGPITVHLWASSSAVDTDFTAKLVDVHPPNEDYPSGFEMNLADYILRARFRNGFEKAEMMTPGTIYKFTIPLRSTSNLFKKGHRIRLDISSSSFPQYSRNPNTGDAYMMGKTIVAENKIYHDEQHPSHVVLPIIPR